MDGRSDHPPHVRSDDSRFQVPFGTLPHSSGLGFDIAPRSLAIDRFLALASARQRSFRHHWFWVERNMQLLTLRCTVHFRNDWGRWWRVARAGTSAAGWAFVARNMDTFSFDLLRAYPNAREVDAEFAAGACALCTRETFQKSARVVITGQRLCPQAPVAESSVALPLQQEGSPAMERPPQPRHDVSYTLLIIVVGVAIGVLFFTVLR